MICDKCKEPVHVCEVWWVHDKTNDTWCDPLQSQFSIEYNTIKPVFEEED